MRAHKTRLIVCLLLAAVSIGALVARRAYDRRRAEMVREDLVLLTGAVDQYVIEHGLTDRQLPTWNNCKPYFYPDSRLFRNQGNDIFGHPYIISPTMEGYPAVDPRTLAALAWVAGPDEFNPTGLPRTPAPEIVLAVRQGSVAWLKDLLNRGVDIGQTDMAGRNALFWAAMLGNAEMARAICSRYPHPANAINREQPPEAAGISPMFEAAHGHAEVVAVFMDYGAVADPVSLSMAAEHAEVLKVLLAKGVSPDAMTDTGYPILLLAVYRDPAAARVLIEAGANVNLRSKNGGTAIHEALEGHHPEIAEMLRAAGAKE